jgi:hypothetical protein
LGKTVGQLLSEITSRELTEWMAYATLEPFGEQRADLRTGLLATVSALGHGAKYTPPHRWLATEDEPERVMSQEEIELEAMRWVANSGGTIVKGERRAKSARKRSRRQKAEGGPDASSPPTKSRRADC